MNDLIWVGNTLLPRWVVFGGVGVIILSIAVILAIIADKAADSK